MTMKNSVMAIPLESIDSASITANFQAINPGGLPAPCFGMRIINNSSIGVTISYNGTTPHDYVLSGEVLPLPYQSEAGPHNDAAYLPKGTIVYVKSPIAGIGLIYLSAYYQP